uniref:Class III homeodomain-leucine zipper protein n=1 Tax=Ceratopteris pteridoides TaxID=58167 RepID=A0A2S1CVL7_9MONI|nr:class III homeodomain-leucine zipper protein [Ceratopteris pteridoides]
MLDTSCDDSISVFSRNSMALVVSQPMMKDHPMHHISGAATSHNRSSSTDQGKYVRYTAEQVQALERLYNECPKPSSLRRQQLVRDFPVLQNIEPKQIKVWFQNRRCREKQRKETSRLQTVNSKLTAMNKLLMEENDRLQKQVAQLMYENGYFRQQLQHGGVTTDTSCDSVVTSGLQHLPAPQQQQSPLQDGSYAGVISLAEEALSDFLSKATGTSVNWIQMPGMKPGPDFMSMVNIMPHGATGIGARACGLINLEPSKIVEVFKDKPTWLRECRRMTTMFSTSTTGGGTIEVLYSQMYAPTTLAPAKDFCTLRYTTVSDDGSYVVCERSLNGAQTVPTAPQISSFVRADMYTSGCLIRPCETSGSIVVVVDHMDLESWSIPEVLRPLYESSTILAHKVTIAALKHLRHIAQENALDSPGAGQQPAAVRSLSHRIAKAFNDAVNGFPDDAWVPLTGDGVDDVTVMMKGPVNAGPVDHLSLHQSSSINSSVLCAKASMLLQHVPPALLVQFMREHRSEWADPVCEEAMRMSNPGFSGFHAATSNSQLLQPQVHSIEEDEFLELIKMEGQNSVSIQDQSLMNSQDMFLLQLCSGLEDKSSGACAQMVFAPIDASVSDDIALIPSGFRVIPLDIEPHDQVNAASSGRTLDLASSLEVSNTTSSGGQDELHSRGRGAGGSLRSVLTIAFQFSCIEARMHDSVACIARQYVRSVVSTIQRVAVAFISNPLSLLKFPQPLRAYDSKNPITIPVQSSLARCICQSYKLYMGADLVQVEDGSSEAYLQALNKMEDALLCCSCKPVPVFTFANRAGMDMLEMPSLPGLALHDMPLERTLDEDGNRDICSLLSQVMQKGYACLSGAGIRMSSRGRLARFERAIAWKVAETPSEEEEEIMVKGVAFLYIKWSLV